jgi:hypothetical protein
LHVHDILSNYVMPSMHNRKPVDVKKCCEVSSICV